MDERCQAILADLHTYLDDECPTTGLADVIREHLEDCPPCLDRADFQRALRTLVATKCKDVAPSGLLERVQSMLDQ